MRLGSATAVVTPNLAPGSPKPLGLLCSCVCFLAHLSGWKLFVWDGSTLVYPYPVKCIHTYVFKMPLGTRESLVFPVVLQSSTSCSTLCAPKTCVLV